MKGALAQCFREVEDPRSTRNQKHPFITIIGTTLLTGLAGIDSFSGIVDFTEARLENLKDYLTFHMERLAMILIELFGMISVLNLFTILFKPLHKLLLK